MADAKKRIRQLQLQSSLGTGGYWLVADPPAIGDAVRVLDTTLRGFVLTSGGIDPTGFTVIAGTDVQTALGEIDAELDALAGSIVSPSGSITLSGYTQTTGKLLGRSTASTGAIEEITVGSGLTLSAGTLSASGTTYTDENAQDAIGAMVDGTLTYTDATPALGVNTTAEAERIRDVIGTALVAGSNVTITVNDAGDTITIAAASGSSNLYDATWFNVKSYGALGDGSTDDTTAIQAAIDACEAAGGGTVYFPRGVYVVNGALQDTSRSNAQLLLPRRDYGDTEAITIVMRGECAPSGVFSLTGSTPLQNNLSVIKGTLNTGTGSLIGAQGPVGTLDLFTNILLVMRDLTVQMPANPVLTALNLSTVAQVDLDNVQVNAGNFDVSTISAQTTTTSYGIRLPTLNNGALTRLGIVNVMGFYNGFEVGEHTVGVDVTAWACMKAFIFTTAYHSSSFTRIQTVHCQRGLVWTGEHIVSIQQYNIEHAASGTWVNTYDVDDGSNYARGFVNWHTVLGGSGVSAVFNVNSALYLRRTHIYNEGLSAQLTDGATVTIDCNQSCNFRWTIGGNRTFANPTTPYDGQVINVRITQDGTGGRTWTLGSKFKFPGGAPTLSTAASAKDFISCQYDANADTWACSIMKALA